MLRSTSSGLSLNEVQKEKRIGFRHWNPIFFWGINTPMHYISTRGGAAPSSFETIVMQGLAPDGGLFVPEAYPALPHLSVDDTYHDIAYKVIAAFMGDTIPESDLKKIIADTYSPHIFRNADITPLTSLGENTYLMELFHGPTLAFKDIALQFLGRLFDYLLEKNGQKITIVGATSGDTGSAAIEACKGRKNISITILHPNGRTSDIQRRQMTSVLADNVHNIAIEGTFDDCQNLVKQCFNDKDLRAAKNLSAVNSINWARIIAQTVYYVVTAHRLNTTPHFAVPTGNFGNVLAAWVAKKMGAPIGKLVIGSNRNDILTRFFETGTMALESVTPSHSPSMDIQISSNFERVLFEILDRDSDRLNAYMTAFKTTGQFSVRKDEHEKFRAEFLAFRCSDNDTEDTIARLYKNHGQIIDPHTAVGVNALEQSGLIGTEACIALACAHPAKFPDVVRKATGIKPPLPAHLADLMDRPERYTVMANDYDALRKHVMGV